MPKEARKLEDGHEELDRGIEDDVIVFCRNTLANLRSYDKDFQADPSRHHGAGDSGDSGYREDYYIDDPKGFEAHREEFQRKRRNKHQLNWFHGVIGLAGLMMESGIIMDGQKKNLLSDRLVQLKDHVEGYNTKKQPIPEVAVLEGEAILDELEDYL